MVSPLPESHLVRLCTSLGDVHPIDPRLLGEAAEVLHTAFTAYALVPTIEELFELHGHWDVNALPRRLLHLLQLLQHFTGVEVRPSLRFEAVDLRSLILRTL